MTSRSRTRVVLTVIGLTLVFTPGHPAASAGEHPARPGGDAVSSSARTLTTDSFEQRILHRINIRRAGAGLSRVRADACLDGHAERWALHLSRTTLLRHRDQQVVIASCDLTWAGEVLVRGTTPTPREAVHAWLASPSHRAVIMKRRAAWAGIGVRRNSQGQTVAVLNAGDRG